MNHHFFVSASYYFFEAIAWGIPELIITVLIILAARRHRLAGLKLLAIGAILSLINHVCRTLLGYTGKITAWASVLSDCYLLTLVLMILGWALLAFQSTEKKD